MKDLKSDIQKIESQVEALVPKGQRSRLKIFLDQFMPYMLILLGSMITFTFFVTPGEKVSRLVNLINVLVVLFFAGRFLLALSLANSHKKFLQDHWFDAVLVLPAVALLREIQLLAMLEAETEERAVMGTLFARTTTISGQIAKMYGRARRTLRL